VTNKKRKNRNLIHLFCPFSLPAIRFARQSLPAQAFFSLRTPPNSVGALELPHSGAQGSPATVVNLLGQTLPQNLSVSQSPSSSTIHFSLNSPPSSTSLSLLHPTSNNLRHRWPCARSLSLARPSQVCRSVSAVPPSLSLSLRPHGFLGPHWYVRQLAERKLTTPVSLIVPPCPDQPEGTRAQPSQSAHQS
jgi:hypothetical protein